MNMFIFLIIYVVFLVAFIRYRHDQIAFDTWGDIINKSLQYRFDLLMSPTLSPWEILRLIQIERESYALWVKKLWNIG